MTSATEDQRVAALHALNVLDTPPEERFDRVTRLCTRLFGVPMAAVNLVDARRQFTKSAVGLATGDGDLAESFCALAVGQPSITVVEDLTADDRFAGSAWVTDDPNLRFYAAQPLEAPGGHRVGTLCLFDVQPRTLTEADQRLLTDLALWVQKELVLDEEMERAAEVQRGLLPTGAPEVEGWDLAGACLPSRDVGGDLLDWYRLPDGWVATVADVMGKGMSAAIVMATLRAVLRAGARSAGIESATALADLTLSEDFVSSGAYATLWLAQVEPGTGRLRYVDAGHRLTLLVRKDGAVQHLDVGGTPVGLGLTPAWEAGEELLEEGDVVVSYSDGLLDLHSDRAAVEAQVREAVATASSADDVVRHLTWAARSLSLPDDVTVLVMRRTA